MSAYTVVWEPEAKRIGITLDDPTFEAVSAAADRLAMAPTKLSHPNGWPFYGRDQRYYFDSAGVRVTLFFRYGQDEQHLFITDVSVLPIP